MQQLEDYHAGRNLVFASKTDIADPLYQTKFAHNLPPLEAYRLICPKQECVSTQKNMQGRYVFFGWNNLTSFEEEHIEKVKEYLKLKLNCEIPTDINDRVILKYAQAYDFNVLKAANSLRSHFDWYNRFLSNPVMTPAGLRLIQSGAIYIFGRDKFYRPNLIFDQTKFRLLFN